MTPRSLPDQPLACTLPAPELRARRATVLRDLRRRVRRVDETADGFVLVFDHAPGLDTELADVIAFEARCCAFVAMATSSSGDGLALHLRFAPEARPVVRATFLDLLDDGPACGCPPAR